MFRGITFLTAPLCVLSLCCLVVLGQTEHEVNLGENVTLDFNFELESPSSTFFIIGHISGSSYPFYTQNQINPIGLKPGQAGRVYGKVDQSQRNVTVTINIHNVHRIDEGLYMVDLKEKKIPLYTHEKYLDVTYPPGRADCQIENPSNPSGDWLAVRCNATVGNDNTGYLMCHQNSKHVPYLEPVSYTDNYMTGLFWMDPTSQVRCCSSYNASFVDTESCNDFVWPSSDGSMSSDKPDLITKAWSSAGPFITDDDMGQHNGTSTIRRVHPGTIVTVAVIIIILLVAAAVCIYRTWRKKKRDNNKESGSSGARQVEDEEHPLEPESRDSAPALSGQTSNGKVEFVKNGETCKINLEDSCE